ncbi:hypothetical protein MAR_013942 [Mya arenaria]|uniref:HMG box domain-containing protein n=1 Tax=Mya arenaria TaxID=6604 RepID=A0ABY7G4Z7_MYAAR|nr:hypothetical protein MAR_013942 [Mya arenaria]
MFRCLLNYSFNLIIWIYSCFPNMGKTTKRDPGTNKSDAVPKRPRFVPTIEKKTAKRVVLSGRDKKCDATQKSPLLLEFVSPVDKRRKVKRKTSSVTTQGKKSQRKGGQSPFFTAFAEMFKSEHQQHKKKKDDFFMVGAGWQKPSDAKDKKTIGTSDAHPDEPRSAVQPVPADEMPDGVDQPADLPDPNYRSLEQKLS